MTNKKVRLVIVATHPVQYQAPLFKYINAMSGIELKVLFFSIRSLSTFYDNEMRQRIKWDVPLTDGYSYKYPVDSQNIILRHLFLFIFLAKEILFGDANVVMVQGWNHFGYIVSTLFSFFSKKKLILRCEATDHFESSSGFRKVFRELFLYFYLKMFSCFGAIGNYNRDFYKNRGISSDYIFDMPYSVDNDFFVRIGMQVDKNSLRNNIGIFDDAPIVLYASKLIKRKNADILLSAYLKLQEPKPWLLIVGNGELRGELELKIEKHSLTRVKMLGFKNQKELPSLYALSDIFVLPSINENWGLVINEAMNMGCAILTTSDVGSAKDLVAPEINGVIVSSPSPESLNEALSFMLREEKYKKMGLESQRIIANWGFKQNIDGLSKALAWVGLKR